MKVMIQTNCWFSSHLIQFFYSSVYFIYFFFAKFTCTFQSNGNLRDYIFKPRSCEHKTLEPVASYIEHGPHSLSDYFKMNKQVHQQDFMSKARTAESISNLRIVLTLFVQAIAPLFSNGGHLLLFFSSFFYLFSMRFFFCFFSFQPFNSSPTRLERKRSF